MVRKIALVALVIFLVFGVITCSGNSVSGAFPWVLFIGLVGIGMYLLIKGR